jgi:hypothetical protein
VPHVSSAAADETWERATPINLNSALCPIHRAASPRDEWAVHPTPPEIKSTGSPTLQLEKITDMIGHEYTVEFRIFSKTLDPNEITKELGLKPCQIRLEGSLGPGNRLQQGMWAYDGGEESKTWDSLSDGLLFLLDKLWPLRDKIAKYKPDAKLIWWCGSFQSSFDGGPTLSAALLSRLGEFGAELFIDNYFGPINEQVM